MNSTDPPDDGVAQSARGELLKDAILLLLPVSSSVGWGILNSPAVAGKIAVFVPAWLAAVWASANVGEWVLLTIACSVWTVFRLLYPVREFAAVKLGIFMLMTPMLFTGHCFVTMFLGDGLIRLFGMPMILID